MDLTNKTVCFLGDSITKGHSASAPEKCYVSLFAAAHPEATVHNFGISGTCIAKHYFPKKGTDRKNFITRLAEMPEHADLVCVFGGTNDFGRGDAPMGKFGDTENDTFYGALYALSLALINKYPTARIVFFTPLHRDHKVEIAVRDDGEWTLEDYVNAVRKNAAYFAFPVLDLHVMSGFQPQVPIIKELYTADGLHPNDRGYEKLFRIVNKFIENLE
jgi:lysophospholipase L1-like esterase